MHLASRSMRTTLTLDEDVAAKLRQEMVRMGASMKDVVNEFLRRGLEAPREEDIARPFTVESRPMGLKAGIDLDDVSGLLDYLDGPAQL